MSDKSRTLYTSCLLFALLGMTSGCGAGDVTRLKTSEAPPQLRLPQHWGLGFWGDSGSSTGIRTKSLVAENLPASGAGLELSSTDWADHSLSWASRSTPSNSVKQAELYFKGKRVANVQLKYTGTFENPEWAVGEIPVFASRGQPQQFAEGTSYYSKQDARARTARQFGYNPELFSEGEEVFFASEKALHPAFLFHISPANLSHQNGPAAPTQVSVDADTGNVISLVPLAFDFTGTTNIYRENPVASAQEGPQPVEIPDLTDPKWLTGTHARVINCERNLVSYQNCHQLAQGENGTFTFPFADPRYDEVVAYTAVTSMMTWYRTLMTNEMRASYGDFGLSHPLDVFVRARKTDGTRALEQAAYLPSGSDGGSEPIIFVGTGWEPGDEGAPTVFQNLGKDADVYRHEFSHHIIFRAVQEPFGQALSFHEGTADYFAYAFSGNNMLAESVGLNGPIRTGEDSRPLSEDIMALEAHHLGEYWSAVLWEVRQKLGTTGDGVSIFDRIVWSSIDFLPKRPNFYQAIAAFLKAADTLAPSLGRDARTLRIQILDVFSKRNFFDTQSTTTEGELPSPSPLLAVTASGVLDSQARTYPTLDPKPIQNVGKATTATTSSKKKSGGRCGVIALSQGDESPSSLWATLALLFAPAGVALFSRKRSGT